MVLIIVLTTCISRLPECVEHKSLLQKASFWLFCKRISTISSSINIYINKHICLQQGCKNSSTHIFKHFWTSSQETIYTTKYNSLCFPYLALSQDCFMPDMLGFKNCKQHHRTSTVNASSIEDPLENRCSALFLLCCLTAIASGVQPACTMTHVEWFSQVAWGHYFL